MVQDAPDAPDADPIVSSFDVLLNPSLPHGRKLWVLQQPNRSEMNQPPASEMRLKTATGMVELDVPTDYMVSYDRDKGMHYGRHLKNSLAVKAGGTHGLSGGFGVGAPPPQRKKRGATADDADDDLFLEWNEALRQDKVLRTQTLGGQLPDHKEVQYMIGVFQGKDLHLTPVSNLVHLRPQLHHVDAVAHQERLAATNAAKEAAGATVAAPNAKAIHMTIKQGGDNNVATTETMLDRLHAVQKEEWRRLKFTDENDEGAWDVYQESLILGGKETAQKHQQNKPDADDDEDYEDKEGKGKEKSHDDDVAKGPELDITDTVSKLSTTWGEDKLLEAVSGIVKPKVLTKEERRKQEEAEAEEAEQKVQQATAEAAKRTAAARRGRGRGSATRGRGGTARGGVRSDAMDLT